MNMLKNKKILFISVIFLFLLLVILIPNSGAIFKSNIPSSINISTAKFIIKLNNSTSNNQTINLNDTLIENNYSNDEVVPGTKGKIDLELDFSETEVSVNYLISLSRTNLPANLKFYSDETMNNEITSISGTHLFEDSSIINKSIYWSWNAINNSESNANDSLYMNSDLSVLISTVISQII